MTICGRCVHLHRDTIVLSSGSLSSIRVRGSGVLLTNPANSKGALLTGALTGVLGIPFYVISTAALARTNCMKRSIRGVVLHLLRTTGFSMTGTRRNVVCMSRVSGVKHGARGISIAESISKRNIRRTLLGVVRNAVYGIPPAKNHGRPRRRCVHIGARGVLFVINNTFIKLRSVVHGHLNTARVKFKTVARRHSHGRCSRRRVLTRTVPRSLFSFNVVPRFIKHLPVFYPLSGLSRDRLIHLLARPGGTLIGRCSGLLTVCNTGLSILPSTLGTVTTRTVGHNAKTHTLHSVFRALVLSIVCAIPDVGGTSAIAVAERAIANGGPTRVRRTSWPPLPILPPYQGPLPF